MLRLRIVERPRNAADDGGEGDAALGMPLRIEENLDMAHAIGSHAGDISGGQVIEILFGQ